MIKEEMIRHIKETYGFEFPMKAKYRRHKSRIYFVTDFKDGEEIEFFSYCDKPSSNALGYAWYINNRGNSKLVSIYDLIQ